MVAAEAGGFRSRSLDDLLLLKASYFQKHLFLKYLFLKYLLLKYLLSKSNAFNEFSLYGHGVADCLPSNSRLCVYV